MRSKTSDTNSSAVVATSRQSRQDSVAGKQFVTTNDKMKAAIVTIREELGQRIAELEQLVAALKV